MRQNTICYVLVIPKIHTICFVPCDANAKGMADCWCQECPPRQRSCYVFHARRTVGNDVLHRFKWNSALGLLSKAVLPLHDRHNTAGEHLKQLPIQYGELAKYRPAEAALSTYCLRTAHVTSR
jgi:hypothetical protein